MMNKILPLSPQKRCLNWFAAVFLIMLFVLTTTAIASEIVDRVVAIVNDDIIRLVELNKAVAPFEETIKSMMYLPGREQEVIYNKRMDILNDLIDQKLADQEISRSGIKVDMNEVDGAIEQIKAMNYYTDEDLRMALLKSGINMEEYRKEIKRQLLRNKLVNFKIKSNIIITQSDLQQYYDQHNQKYGSKKKYMLRNIIMMFPDVIDDNFKKAVYLRMEIVHNQLADGALFEEMSKEYSEASNATDGGELGLFNLDDLSENIQVVVKALKSGEFSSIVETDQGYQIFYLEKIVETPGRTLSEVEDEIQHTLYEESVNEKFESWIGQLREEAHIKIIR